MNNPYIKFDEIYDSIFKKHLAKMFKKSYREGWYISEILLKSDGNWLIKWDVDLTKPLPK